MQSKVCFGEVGPSSSLDGSSSPQKLESPVRGCHVGLFADAMSDCHVTPDRYDHEGDPRCWLMDRQVYLVRSKQVQFQEWRTNVTPTQTSTMFKVYTE